MSARRQARRPAHSTRPSTVSISMPRCLEMENRAVAVWTTPDHYATPTALDLDNGSIRAWRQAQGRLQRAWRSWMFRAGLRDAKQIRNTTQSISRTWTGPQSLLSELRSEAQQLLDGLGDLDEEDQMNQSRCTTDTDEPKGQTHAPA